MEQLEGRNTPAMIPARAMIARHLVVATPSSATLLFHSASASVVGVGTRVSQQRRQLHQILPTRHTTRQHNQQQHNCVQHIRNFARGRQRTKRGYPKNNIDHSDKYSFEDIGEKEEKNDKNVLVIGSSGVLGKHLVSHLGSTCGWNVIGADILDPSQTSEEKGLRDYILLPKDASMADLTSGLFRGVSLHLQGGKTNENKLDAIVCASGGWEGDVDMANLIENHLAKASMPESEDVDFDEEHARESTKVCERMMRVNYYPTVAGSHVARRFMKRGGLFCTIGASAALSPTSGMVGYGSAKSAAHHYIQSWGLTSMEEKGIKAVGILPLMIDTPANRDMLGGDDTDGGDDRYSKMVKPIHIATEIGEWLKQSRLMPHTGSLVKVIAKNRRDGTGGAAFHLAR